MKLKVSTQQKKAIKIRQKIRSLGINRLTVYKTAQHIYAQVFSSDGAQVIADVSTLQSEVKQHLKCTGNIGAARLVGRLIAEKSLARGVARVAFDRSGFKYHGRIKALAESARENGLVF